MLTQETIQIAVDRILAVAKPNKVIMFGSYARGNANEYSDLDLMVVEPEVSNKSDEMIRLRSAIGSIGVGVDILVCSETEAKRRGQVPGTVIYWALKEGKVLYEAGP